MTRPSALPKPSRWPIIASIGSTPGSCVSSIRMDPACDPTTAAWCRTSSCACTMKFDGRVVSNFIVQALKGEPVTVHGDGSQTRSFCYVDDLVDGIVRLFERGGPDPTNIGNPNEFTVRQLAGLVLRLTGSRSRIVEQPLPTDDPKVRQPDIQRARETLGWEPKISLEDGLRRTIEYFGGLTAA